MKAWLEPLFGDDYGDVALGGLLLPIGQNDAPFDTYPEALRKQLAERHARLFLDGDTLYVVDLNSGTGTTLNDAPVKDEPLAVAAGDILCFGEDLRFQACLSAIEEVEEDPSAAPDETDEAGERTEILELPTKPTLLLLPLKSGQGPSPIAVSDFPFLVSKSSGHFAVYKQQFAAQLSFVSRRHAHIYARGTDLYIEDLGSTNGTLHNGKRLEGTAERLNSGDTLQFGHELFSFKVELELAPVESNQAAATRRTVPEGTILVSTAGSFLDIYCDTPEPEAESSAEEVEAAPLAQAPAERVKALLATTRDNARTAWEAVPLGKEMRLGLLALLGLVIAVALGAWLFADDRAEEVAALLEQEQYEPALLLAEEYLVDNPDDAAVDQFARQALIGYLVPGWSQAIVAEDYPAAESLLYAAQQQSASQEDSGVVALLQWIGELQRYVSTRESPDTVRLSEEQHTIAALLESWNAESDQNMRLLDELARDVPAFDPVRVAALSELRALKSDASVLLEAMRALRSKVLRPLDADAGSAALEALDSFERDYPRVNGVDTWRADVLAYLRLKEAYTAGKLLSYLQEKRDASFSTDYFSEQVAAEYPSVEELEPIAAQYALADRQWRDGDFAASLQLLGKLAQGKWGTHAANLLDHRQQLQTDFMRLPQLYQTEDYQTELLAFYTRIDPERDKFMFDALQTDFSDQQEFAALRAEQLNSAGERSWQDYQSLGGISGALRLESQISERYREQAARLREAHNQLRQAAQIYALMGEDLPESTSPLYAAVVAEAERQYQAIEDLGAVLGAATVQAKTALLPTPVEAQ